MDVFVQLVGAGETAWAIAAAGQASTAGLARERHEILAISASQSCFSGQQ
jgi:hypothetical protein